MTEIVRVEQEHTLHGDPTTELVAWARAAEAAAELARPLAQTSFVPEVYQGKPGDAAAAILVGAEVGLTPMQALQGIYVIKGKPAMYARTLMAIVLAAGHEVWTEKASPDRVVVKGRRRGSDRIETSEWTIGRAQKAGYTSNAKYKTDPESMLLARAQAELCRRLAPDAILGMAYAVEELDDDEPAPAGKRAVSRRTPAKTAPAPDPASAWDAPSTAPRAAEDPDLPPLPGEDTADPVVEADVVEDDEPFAEPEPLFPPPDRAPGEPVTPTGDRPGFITRAQLRMLHVALGKVGLGDDRDAALRFYAEVGGRVVESSKDLTRIEASRIIDRLLAMGAEGAGFEGEQEPE